MAIVNNGKESLALVFAKCGVRINMRITDHHFKIGKSGDDEADTKNRYTEYNKWEVIYRDDDNQLIDDLEVKLIERFMQSYPDTCDNKEVDVGPDGGCSYIYLAYDVNEEISR